MAEATSTEALQTRLLDEKDPGERAAVHLELGRLALRDGRLDPAARHLREALFLNRGLDAARDLLRDLGEEATGADRGSGPGWFRSALGRLRRRAQPTSRG